MSKRDTAKALGMLDELLDDDTDKMTRWEIDFIDAMDGKREEGREWTMKEAGKIEEVWCKVFGA